MASLYPQPPLQSFQDEAKTATSHDGLRSSCPVLVFHSASLRIPYMQSLFPRVAAEGTRDLCTPPSLLDMGRRAMRSLQIRMRHITGFSPYSFVAAAHSPLDSRAICGFHFPSYSAPPPLFSRHLPFNDSRTFFVSRSFILLSDWPHSCFHHARHIMHLSPTLLRNGIYFHLSHTCPLEGLERSY